MSSCYRCASTASVEWFGAPYCSACALAQIGTEAAKHFWVIYGGTYTEPVAE